MCTPRIILNMISALCMNREWILEYHKSKNCPSIVCIIPLKLKNICKKAFFCQLNDYNKLPTSTQNFSANKNYENAYDFPNSL